MKKPLVLTIGSDPEFVIAEPSTLLPCSALRILRNDKNHPMELGDGIKFYADNVLAEIAFPPTALDGIVERLGLAIARAQHALGPYKLIARAATMFPSKELRGKAPWQIGCNPNYDAYRFDINTGSKFTDGLRTGSFHIHIGNAHWQHGRDDRLLSDDSKIEAVKLMDLFVGLSSIIWDHDPTAAQRRKLYGKAGEFRPTKYGIEYRVLGNYALRHQDLLAMVFELVKLAMGHVEHGTGPEVLRVAKEKDIIESINSHDRATASHILQKLPMPSELLKHILALAPVESELAWVP